MAEDSLTQTTRKAPYLEAREKALLDQLFGTFNEDTGDFSGGLFDPKEYPDLFKIPEYKIAGQTGRDSEGNITGLGPETFAYEAMMEDVDGDGVPDFLGRSQDYFDQSQDLLGIGEGADGAKQQFDDASTVLDEAKDFYGSVDEEAGDMTATDLLQSGSGMYDPTSEDYGVSKYMTDYDDAVLAQVEKDIERQGDQSRQRAADAAVKAGAYGGSRQGLQAAEVERNILDAKAKASADLRQASYDKALAASQSGFEKGMTRDLEAGRLLGGLGQSYGGLGTAMGGLGTGMSGAAGTAADVGRVHSSLSPADLAFMTGVGQTERDYRQDVIDTGRLEDMRKTDQALMPLNVGIGMLQGTPSAGVSSMYQNTYAQQANPMVSGLGAYTAMQGIRG
tara:strand:+ start:2300 stop:3475 length:1176 start_codon:yes stop_codon:yes gene_type:complete